MYEPSDAELEILHILWAKSPASVREIHDQISTRREVGYTTILKQVQRLSEKGILTREIVEGAHLYSSKFSAEEIKTTIAGKLLQTAFGGSAVQLLLHAVGDGKTSEEDLQQLQLWLDQQMNKK